MWTPVERATSTTVSEARITPSVTWTTPFPVWLSAPTTWAWFTNTPASPTVTLIVLVSFNGVGVIPFVKSVLKTLEPITWYVKISVNPSEANNSSAVNPNSPSAATKASSVGAKTV